MLKPKVAKLILEELKIKALDPFSIEGESFPYRLKKDGNMERCAGDVWGDTGYSYLDLICLIDAGRVKPIKVEE